MVQIDALICFNGFLAKPLTHSHYSNALMQKAFIGLG